MKEAQRRLLDLLAGWGQYVDQCAESEDAHVGVTREAYERESAAIHELYQEVGRVQDMQSLDIGVFVRRIEALLIEDPTNARSRGEN